MALLRELYGNGIDRLRFEHQTFEAPSKRKLEIVTIASNYHIDLKFDYVRGRPGLGVFLG